MSRRGAERSESEWQRCSVDGGGDCTHSTAQQGSGGWADRWMTAGCDECDRAVQCDTAAGGVTETSGVAEGKSRSGGERFK